MSDEIKVVPRKDVPRRLKTEVEFVMTPRREMRIRRPPVGACDNTERIIQLAIQRYKKATDEDEKRWIVSGPGMSLRKDGFLTMPAVNMVMQSLRDIGEYDGSDEELSKEFWVMTKFWY